MKLLRLWCEWDFGQDGFVFSNKEKAHEWFNTNENIIEMFNDDIQDYPADSLTPFEYYYTEGLLGFEEIEVK